MSYAAARAASRPAAARNFALRPQALLAVIALGALVVIYPWWRDQPADLATAADWLTAAGRITGLLAGYGIAVQLLLMARVPALDRGIGTDQLARWHAAGGRYTISLIVAHTLLITWGYAAGSHTGVITQARALLVNYPDVLMATVSLALFVLVGVISARAVRRRVNYETWYYLHLYTYLALALSFAHVFAEGNEFRTHPAARIGYAALYIAVGLLLFTYRIALPGYRAWRHPLRVIAVRREAPGVLSLHIGGRDLAGLGGEPGQFFRWRFLTADGWWQSHPFSLSAVAHPRLLRITVKTLGDYTAALQQTRPGTRVIAEGPYGAVTPAKRGHRRVALLAGGVGITAVRALAEHFAGGAPHEVVLLYRVNDASEIVFRGELDSLAARGGLDAHYLVGEPGSTNDVLVGDRLAATVPDIAERDVFVCGPDGFVDAALAALCANGVPTANIHLEHYAL